MPDKHASETSLRLGFAGAALVDWQHVIQHAQPGDLVFFGCDTQINRRYGIANPGAAEFIRTRTALTELTETGCYDIGAIPYADSKRVTGEIAATAARIITRFGGLPALIACDHTASLGAVFGSFLGIGVAPVYLYFDAHFDLGRNCVPEDKLHNGGFVGELLRNNWIQQAINIGGRSPETKIEFPATPRFTSIPSTHSAKDVITQLTPLKGREVHVSIDADVLDPSHAPNVACPEYDGMSADDLLTCCRWIGQSCRVVGADLSELLPSPNSNFSELLLMKCMLALKKTGVQA